MKAAGRTMSSKSSYLLGLLVPVGFREEPYRAVHAVVFWVVLVLHFGWAVFFATDFGSYTPELVPITLTFAALAVVYPLLPWERPFGRLGWITVVTFPLLMLLAATLVGEAQIFVMLPVAHAVYVLGWRGSIFYAAALVPPVVLGYLLRTAEAGVGAEQAIGATVGAVAVMALVIVVCASVVRSGERQKQTRALLSELEEAHARLAFAHAELEHYAAKTREMAISEERTRMAREIHDTLGHHLTGVSLQLDHARRSKNQPEEAWEEIEEARELVLSALAEVRRSVRALKPLALEERSGIGALSALARSFEGSVPEVSFEVKGDERKLPEEAELVLYRAMQEGLTNTFRHANARRVHSVLSFENGYASLCVADDGNGAPDGAADSGFGLAALRTRAEALDGKLRAGTRGGATEGGGFVLEVNLPVESQAEALAEPWAESDMEAETWPETRAQSRDSE